MGQVGGKVDTWIERAKQLEKSFEQMSSQIESQRIAAFDLAEIPHLREIGEASFQRDLFLLENSVAYMQNKYSQRLFLAELNEKMKKITEDILQLKTQLLKLNKTYERLLQAYGQYEGTYPEVHETFQRLDWKRQVLVDYFLEDIRNSNKSRYDDAFMQSLYEVKSRCSLATLARSKSHQPTGPTIAYKKFTSLDTAAAKHQKTRVIYSNDKNDAGDGGDRFAIAKKSTFNSRVTARSTNN